MGIGTIRSTGSSCSVRHLLLTGISVDFSGSDIFDINLRSVDIRNNKCYTIQSGDMSKNDTEIIFSIFPCLEKKCRV